MQFYRNALLIAGLSCGLVCLQWRGPLFSDGRYSELSHYFPKACRRKTGLVQCGYTSISGGQASTPRSASCAVSLSNKTCRQCIPSRIT